MGHVRMMAAAQPFISGAISKTINMPENATVEEIMEAYIQSWKLGLKAVAVYRDGSKKAQPLSSMGSATAKSGKTKDGVILSEAASAESKDPYGNETHESDAPPRAVRHRLPDERFSITHKFNVGGHEGYLTVGLYKEGMPGEIFITMAKEGSTVSGLMDSFACAISIGLQHGVPLKLLCEKFAHTRFEPSGWSRNPDIGYAKSIMDYIFRWLQLRFLTGQQQALFDGLRPKYVNAPPPGTPDETATAEIVWLQTAPLFWAPDRSERCPGSRLEMAGPRARGRRLERPDRHGGCACVHRLWSDHDQERKLLPLCRVWEHEWMFVGWKSGALAPR